MGQLYIGNGITYSTLWSRTLRFAGYLSRLGVEKGDRVGLLLANTPQFIIAFNGVLAAGGVVVAVNPLNPVEEIGRELAETECKVLVVLDRLLGKLPSGFAGKVVVADAAEYAPAGLRLLGSIAYRGTRPAGAVGFGEATSGEEAKPVSDRGERGPRCHTLHIRHNRAAEGRHAHPLLPSPRTRCRVTTGSGAGATVPNLSPPAGPSSSAPSHSSTATDSTS